jgi:hypothetical protein
LLSVVLPDASVRAWLTQVVDYDPPYRLESQYSGQSAVIRASTASMFTCLADRDICHPRAVIQMSVLRPQISLKEEAK